MTSSECTLRLVCVDCIPNALRSVWSTTEWVRCKTRKSLGCWVQYCRILSVVVSRTVWTTKLSKRMTKDGMIRSIEHFSKYRSCASWYKGLKVLEKVAAELWLCANIADWLDAVTVNRNRLYKLKTWSMSLLTSPIIRYFEWVSASLLFVLLSRMLHSALIRLLSPAFIDFMQCAISVTLPEQTSFCNQRSRTFRYWGDSRVTKNFWTSSACCKSLSGTAFLLRNNCNGRVDSLLGRYKHLWTKFNFLEPTFESMKIIQYVVPLSTLHTGDWNMITGKHHVRQTQSGPTHFIATVQFPLCALSWDIKVILRTFKRYGCNGDNFIQHRVYILFEHSCLSRVRLWQDDHLHMLIYYHIHLFMSNCYWFHVCNQVCQHAGRHSAKGICSSFVSFLGTVPAYQFTTFHYSSLATRIGCPLSSISKHITMMRKKILPRYTTQTKIVSEMFLSSTASSQRRLFIRRNLSVGTDTTCDWSSPTWLALFRESTKWIACCVFCQTSLEALLRT